MVAYFSNYKNLCTFTFCDLLITCEIFIYIHFVEFFTKFTIGITCWKVFNDLLILVDNADTSKFKSSDITKTVIHKIKLSCLLWKFLISHFCNWILLGEENLFLNWKKYFNNSGSHQAFPSSPLPPQNTRIQITHEIRK